MGRASRRGNAAYTVVSVMTLIGFGALTIDIGKSRVARAELQNAAEAASHAAAMELDGTAAGLTSARATAVAVAALNTADGRSVVIDGDADVVLGVYDADAGTFTESDDPDDVNAVRVYDALDDMSTIFSGAAFGTSSLAAGATAMGLAGQYGGAGGTKCFLPFALPLCVFDGRTDEALNLVDLKLQPATGDNIGWGNPWANPTPPSILAQLNGQCGDEEVVLGDPLYLGNGADTSAMNYVANAISTSTTTWNTSAWGALPTKMSGSAISTANYGKTLEGPIILFDGGSAYCDSSASTGSWNSTVTIAGFAWGSVYDVKVSGGSATRNIKMRLELLDDYDFGTSGGGPDHGVVYEEPPHVSP